MYPKALLVALLSLALSVAAIPAKGNNASSAEVCDTSAVAKTVTVTVGAAAATSTGLAALTSVVATPNASVKTTIPRGNTGRGNTGKGNTGKGNIGKGNTGKGNTGTQTTSTSVVAVPPASTSVAAAPAASTFVAAVPNAGTPPRGGNNANSNGAAPAGNDPRTSLTLDKASIQDFTKDGSEAPAAGQEVSETSTNNFINFCSTDFPGKELTSGRQVVAGSCNGAPMGVIAAQTNMPSSKFLAPRNSDVIPANTDFAVRVAMAHLETGHFTNPQSTYFAAPQRVNAQGDIIGHTHVVIEKYDDAANVPNDPRQFAFFQGLNSAAVGGVVSTTVTGGLPAGHYKISTINSAANHQPVLVAVAQHASLDDAIFFTVADGAAGNNANNAANNSTAAATTAAAAPSASAPAATNGQNGANRGTTGRGRGQGKNRRSF